MKIILWKFGAKLTNWALFYAYGASAEDAKNNLKRNFKEYALKNTLPRPGSKVHVQFAKANRIKQYEYIAVDFFDKIIGIDYYDCFVSDLTTLFDFDLDLDTSIEKIKNEYNIEPNEDLTLIDIFQLIKNLTK